jgi:hypothetical protein
LRLAASWREIVIVKRFFLEGEINGPRPGLVRWLVLRPADNTLQWFDGEQAQEMLASTTEMFSRLEVKEGNAPLPSVPAEPPSYRATLDDGAIVVGYFDNTD